MSRHRLPAAARAPRLPAACTAVAEQLAPALERAERDKPGYTQFLHDLLDRRSRRRPSNAASHGRLRFAKLPARKTLEQFDFDAQPSLDRRLVEDLATLRFIEDNANVLLIGPPGVGKTMLAIALGHQRRRGRLPRLLHHRRRPRRPHRQGRDRGPLGEHDALLERAAAADRRRARLPADARRSRQPPLPGHQPPLRTRLDRPDHQPRHRRLGPRSSTTPPSPPRSSTASCTTPPSSPINGDSYRMRHHRDAIASLRPAITGGEFP